MLKAEGTETESVRKKKILITNYESRISNLKFVIGNLKLDT